MSIAILGKKIGMTRFFDEQGVSHPCTVIQAGPCTVLQVKTEQTDGYGAVQIGYGAKKPHRSTKPMIGHARKANAEPPEAVREFRLDNGSDREFEVGGELTVADFEEIKWVDVTGVTKGKGFQGVMKRWKFGGQPASHGTERKHRSAGGIGSQGGSRLGARSIKKGKHMAGHMGSVTRTARNLKLLGVDAEKNVLIVRGAVPGASGGLVVVKKSRTKG